MLFWVWRLYHTAAKPDSRHRSLARATAHEHVLFIGTWFFIGVALLVLLLVLRGPRLRQVACVGVVVVIFMQGGYLQRGENKTVDAAQFFRFPPAARNVAAEVGDDQTIWVDGASLPPDLNLWYRLKAPGNYDVLGLKTYDSLYRKLLRPPSNLEVGGAQLGILGGPVKPLGTRALAVLGIRRVVTNKSYPLGTRTNIGVEAEPSNLDRGQTFQFTWQEGAHDVVVLYTQGLPSGTPLEVAFSGRGIGTTRAQRVTTRGHIAVADLPTGLPRDGQLTLTARSTGDVAGATPDARVSAVKALNSPIPGLRLDQSRDGFQVFTVTEAAGLASSPSVVTWAATNAEAFRRVVDPSFDPKKEVVLEGSPDPGGTGRASGAAGVVTVDRETPGDLTLHVKRTTPGYLVVNENDYPGWRATVDGHSRPVLRANSTFMAVAVPAGTSTVRLRFRPTSVRGGALISITAFVLMVIALTLAMWWPRERGQARQLSSSNDG